MEDKICTDGTIWDLHIHTNKCPKSTGEFGKLDTKIYVDKLITLTKKYPNLKMISFTDHNQISTDVYEEYYSRNNDIKLIPGIEVDVDFEENLDSKHVIVYFDDSAHNFKEIAKKVNEIMRKYQVSDKQPIKISSLFTELADENFNFLLSPHAFKQRKRDINEDWVGGDTNKRAKKYVNQFFCFWESSGLKEIARAKSLLKTFFKHEEYSIVSFSDSSNFQELENYLSNPPIYFHSLPTFKGIQLVGSDSSRIAFDLEETNPLRKSKLIGEINFDNNSVLLSSKLNTIIGGRGTGKSILLDRIARKLNLRPDIDKYKRRNEYIDKFHLSLNDQNGSEINSSFKVDYFDQNYVSKIFNSQDRNKELEEYFANEFSKIDRFNIKDRTANIRDKYIANSSTPKFIEVNDNLGNIIESYKMISDNELPIKVIKRKIPKVSLIDDFDIEKQHEVLFSTKIIPKEISDNSTIANKVKELQRLIVLEIEKYNVSIIQNQYLSNAFLNNIYEYKKNRSEDSKQKAAVAKLIEDKICKGFNKYLKRVSIINALLSLIDNNFTFENESKDHKKESLSEFAFKRELTIENPIDYFVRVFDEYVSSKNYGDIKRSNIYNLVKTYCTDIEDYKKESKNLDDMDDELLTLNLKTFSNNKIYYKGKDLENMSPGSQTNILMEYIVKADSTVPLLIDQPEDNVDNNAIYNDLTTWISELKYKRQIIVVTHDANIVINADAENLILADQIVNNKFKYVFGALEYNDNLSRASIILDGGAEAVKRRLLKYGE